MRRFWAKKMQKRPPTELMTVRRWQRSAVAERRWGSLTKCRITKFVTVRHGYDGPSCRFVVKIREVIPVPRFQELRYVETRPSMDFFFLWRSVTLAVEGNEESSRRIALSMGRRSPRRSVMTTTVRRVVPSTQPRFCRFPVIRILV